MCYEKFSSVCNFVCDDIKAFGHFHGRLSTIQCVELVYMEFLYIQDVEIGTRNAHIAFATHVGWFVAVDFGKAAFRLLLLPRCHLSVLWNIIGDVSEMVLFCLHSDIVTSFVHNHAPDAIYFNRMVGAAYSGLLAHVQRKNLLCASKLVNLVQCQRGWVCTPCSVHTKNLLPHEM